MALFEGGVVHGVLLFAHDVGGVRHEIARIPRRYAQAKILRNHLGEAARGAVALHADHGAVPEQRGEAVAVLEHLVGVPMGIYADVKELHEEVAVARGYVSRLHYADVGIVGEIFQAALHEVGRDDLVGIEYDKVIEVRRLLRFQKVVQIARLEALSARAAHHLNVVFGGKLVDLLPVFLLVAVVQDEKFGVFVGLLHAL